jgi:ABC-2 type transport system ATP-binding protein
MIAFERVSKRFGRVEALSAVSFEVKKGTLVGLLGPNGAGKTTCLRLISGVLFASSGRVVVAGKDVSAHPLAIKGQLGYLPEGAPIYPDSRVHEYLAFRARLKRLPRAKRKTEVQRVMALCGLEDVARRIVGQLSRGYRQRLGLADALLGDPSLIVLDEPTVGLDPNQLRELRELIRSLADERTVLLSTHVLSEVEAICDHVLIIDRGKLLVSGTLDQLMSEQGGLQLDLLGDPSGAITLLQAFEPATGVDLAPSPEAGIARLWVRGNLDAKARALLVSKLVEAGVELVALVSTKARLEHIFSQLTAEQPQDRTQAAPSRQQDDE